MTDITEVKRELIRRAQDVAEHLLPNGKRVGHEWRCGSVLGEEGESLGVHLSGQKAGVWSDFASGESGDLLDLWCLARGLKLPEALDEARAFVGMEPLRFERPANREYKTPPKPDGLTKPKDAAHIYLTEGRNLSDRAIAAYRIGEAGGEIIFPFLLPDGSTPLIKRRPAEDGAKPKPTAADCRPVLFGWQAIPDDARQVAITEGEIDAMSLWDYGFPALSVPFGGGGGNKQQWIEHEFDRLARFERIYLALDMDGPGDEAADTIAERLGRHRCWRVMLPRKDANECLLDGISAEEITEAFEKAKGLDPDDIARPVDFIEEVTRLFHPRPEDHIGYSMPYSDVRDKLLFRPSEMTIWTGTTGGGKSQILSDCLPAWIQQGSRVAVLSLEMKPGQLLRRLVKQVTGIEGTPSEAVIAESCRWLNEGLFFYNKQGKVGCEKAIETFEYLRARYGCDQFVADSLMRLSRSAEDYVAQEKAVFDLVSWAMEKKVHVHLVVHSRKTGDGGGVPQSEDVKGAIEIAANASNIVTVWRNRKLEEEIAEAGTDLAALEELKRKPNVIMNVAKQRNGDFEGKIPLWYNKQSYQYRSSKEGGLWNRSYLARSEGADR